MSRSFAVNASPIILLTRIGHLHLLSALADKVVVPHAVIEELRARDDRDQAASVVEAAGWTLVVPNLPVPAEVQAWDLDAGESQVISYALEQSAVEAVLDDRAGRRCAKALGVPTIGTLGVVLACKRKSKIPLARPIVEAPVSHGMFLADEIMNGALAEVGE